MEIKDTNHNGRIFLSKILFNRKFDLQDFLRYKKVTKLIENRKHFTTKFFLTEMFCVSNTYSLERFKSNKTKFQDFFILHGTKTSSNLRNKSRAQWKSDTKLYNITVVLKLFS